MAYRMDGSNAARLDTMYQEDESQSLECLLQEGYKCADMWTVRAGLTSLEWAANCHVRVLLCNKLTVVLLVKKFPVLYSVGWFGAVFIVALSLYLVRRHINPFHLLSVVMWLHMWLYYCAQSCCDLKIVVLLLWSLSCRYCAHFRKLLCTLWYCAHSCTITVCIDLNIVTLLLCTLWYFCFHVVQLLCQLSYSYFAQCDAVTVHIVYHHCVHWTLLYCCCAHGYIFALHVVQLLCTLSYHDCAHCRAVTVHILTLL
jgi:hypothetical protein